MLAGLGRGFTICLRKSQQKEGSFYEQYDEYFNYHTTKDVILGRKKPNTFTPKRIVVIQMK